MRLEFRKRKPKQKTWVSFFFLFFIFSKPLLLFSIGLKFLQCPDAHINNCSIEQGTNLDWTRNKEKQEGKKMLAQIEQGTRKSKKKKKDSEKTSKINAAVGSGNTSSLSPNYQDWFRYLFWVLFLVLFLGFWGWKWERMTSDPLSILLSRCRCCRLLWKWLLERRWEHEIGIRTGVRLLFCCCFMGLLLREDESMNFCFCFLGLLRDDESVWLSFSRFCLGNSSSTWKSFHLTSASTWNLSFWDSSCYSGLESFKLEMLIS